VTAPTLSLSNASKWYGDVLAVNDVTAEVGAGVTGLLGPNGAGKSTLLKLATGMLRPSLGVVRLLGEDPFDNPAIMRRVGLCPEQDAVYPGATAFDTVAYLTRLHGFSRRDAATRARSALERVGLASAMDRAVDGYSKGMRQRCKLAQAIAHDPELIVLDEPLNGLDPVARREMTRLVRSFGEEGRCVLVSSHVLHEIESMTHRVLLLSHGMVVAEGTIEEIRRDLSDRPLAIRIDAPDPRAVAARLLATDGIRRLDLEPARLDVLTTRPTVLFRELARLASEDGVSVTRFRTLDESLEAVFRYLTT
jgi:ABC-2 type transport system ATP-binding protein